MKNRSFRISAIAKIAYVLSTVVLMSWVDIVSKNLKYNELYEFIFKCVLFRYLSYGRYIIDLKAPAAFLNGLLIENIPSVEDEDDEEEEWQNVSD